MKYEINICSCGRIHFIPRRNEIRAFNSNKELAIICGGCGTVKIIGANKGYDPYLEDICFEKYSTELQDKTEITRTQFKADPKGKQLYKIIYSKGIRVLMETGYFADRYSTFTRRFTDNSHPDFLTFEMSKVNPDIISIKKGYESWNTKRALVNMNSLVYNSGLKEDELKELSNYHIDGLDWNDFPFGMDSRSAKVKKNYICMRKNFHIGEKYTFKIVDDDIKVFYKTSSKKYDYMLFDKEEFLEYFDCNLKGVNL